MLSKKIKVNNSVGLHARPVSVIAAEAQKYISNISIKYGKFTVSAKSSVKLLSLCVGAGKYVELICEGPDEYDAMEHLTQIFKKVI
jgi:phosphotransferase system HPr (HPr) family protein